jgi:hypothetical protein
MWDNLDNSKTIMMLKQFQKTSKYLKNIINFEFNCNLPIVPWQSRNLRTMPVNSYSCTHGTHLKVRFHHRIFRTNLPTNSAHKVTSQAAV